MANILFSNVDKHSVEGEYPVRLCNYSDVYHNDRVHADMDFMDATATADEIERFRVAVGDVLITKDSESWDDIGVPALVASARDNDICGYHLALLRPIAEIATGEFLHRVLSSRPVACQFFIRANGVTRFGLSQGAVKSVRLPIPPLTDQAVIVRFLARATGQVKRFVGATEELIALLEEQKRAVVHRAVTGQIDVCAGQRYAAYKDSGVGWLGRVPSHWTVKPIGRFARVGNGSTPARGKESYWLGGRFPWLTSASVNRGIVTKADQFVTVTALRECHLPKVTSGSVLVGITGQGRTRGMAALLAIEATINQHLAYIEPDQRHARPEFLHHLLTAAYRELRAISSASGSTKDALTTSKLKSFKVALPPVPEQDRICTALERGLGRVDRRIDCERRKIKLMEEYGERLVADAVTGEVGSCVRGQTRAEVADQRRKHD